MADQPNGPITFLLAELRANALPGKHPEKAMAATVRHGDQFRAAIRDHDGHVFTSVDDSFCAVFTDASDAVAAALDAQQRLLAADVGGEIEPPEIRMALYTGVASERHGSYYGPAVNRAVNLLRSGHRGQILLSQSTYELIRGMPPEETTLVELGEYGLEDQVRPERVFQIKETHPWGVQRSAQEEPRPALADVERELDDVQSRLSSELRAKRPELFDASGRPRKRALEKAVQEHTGQKRLTQADILDLLRKKSC